MNPQPLSWPQRRQLWARLLIRLLIFLAIVLFLFLAGRPILSLTMPFLLALVFTWMTEPLLGFFHRKWKIPRGILSFLLVVLLVGAIGGVITALVWKAWDQFSTLGENWDVLWNSFQGAYLEISHTADRLLALLPTAVSDLVHDLSDRLLLWLRDFAYGLVPQTTSAARSISSFVLAFLFFLMAWYFTAADYPHIKESVVRRIPEPVAGIAQQLRRAFSAAFGGYLKAEVLISLGVMVILLVGFLVIGQPYSILLAVLLGVMDFIPIIGAGTAMVPWAVALILLGKWQQAVPLLVIWGIICLFRRFMEPKVVGDQTGLHPLLSLLAIYVGMKLGGVLGMILGPVLLIMLRNLWQAGMFRETVGDLAMAGGDFTALLRKIPREETKN